MIRALVDFVKNAMGHGSMTPFGRAGPAAGYPRRHDDACGRAHGAYPYEVTARNTIIPPLQRPATLGTVPSSSSPWGGD
jgi:hypothetical protein